MLWTRNPVYALLLAGAVSPAARGQDAAKSADDNRTAIRAKLAAAPVDSPLRRLRVDGFAAAGDSVNVTGLFFRDGTTPAADEDKALQTALGKVLEDVTKLKFPGLSMEKLTRVKPADLPHVKLQAAANAAAEDELFLDATTFDADGKAVFAGRVGSERVRQWVRAAAAKAAPEISAAAADRLEVIDWKLGRAALQRRLAAAGKTFARTRVERVYCTWAADAENPLAPSVVVRGVFLDTPPDTKQLVAEVERLWPDLSKPGGVVKPTVDTTAFVGGSSNIPETVLVNLLRAAIADRPELDGVRIDEKMSFDGAGNLVLAGVTPTPDAAFAGTLEAAVVDIVRKSGKVREGENLSYAQIVAAGASAKALAPVRTDKLRADVRAWAAEEVDDVLLNRLYFDKCGKLTLVGHVGAEADVPAVRKKYEETAAKYLSGGPNVAATAINLKPFPAGFTAHLRDQVAADQKAFDGVLVERGYFTAAGAYAVRGLVDRADQNPAVAALVAAGAADPRWKGYFAAPASAVDFDVMPLAGLLDRVKRVAPGYSAFDRLEVTRVIQTPKSGLVFPALRYGEADADHATRTLEFLLTRSPDGRRRAKQGAKLTLAAAAPVSPETIIDAPGVAVRALVENNLPRAKAAIESGLRHNPGSSTLWYESALYHQIMQDPELVRRDLYRVIQIEGDLHRRIAPELGPRGDRYAELEPFQGDHRAEVRRLEHWLRRQIRDGRDQIRLVPTAEPVVPRE